MDNPLIRSFGKGTAGNFSDLADAPKVPAPEPINALCVKAHMLEPPVQEAPGPSHPLLGQASSKKNQQFIIPTPVRVSVLAQYLEGYDQESSDYLITGVSKGFSLGTVGVVTPSVSPNHSSVSPTSVKFIQTKLDKEISLGRIKGPYNEPPLSDFISSPLGVVPKKEPNSFRLIHNLSFGGLHGSVNSFIPFENSTVSLETFDHVVSLVLRCGKNSLISKGDLEDAYRTVPISPLDYHKLGFSFQDKFYFDCALPMGASSSVRIYESFSKALQWILQEKFSVQFVSHIIDDFIFVGPSNSYICEGGLKKFLCCVISLTFQLNPPKLFGLQPVHLFMALKLALFQWKLACQKTRWKNFLPCWQNTNIGRKSNT